MRCRRVVGDWMISSRELAAFPAKLPILRREKRKAISMVKKDIRIRKMGAAGSANTVYPVFFFILNSLLHYSTFWFLAVIYRNTKYRIMHFLCPSPLTPASPPYVLFGGLLKVCNHELWSDAQCDLNQIIKDSMIGVHSPELKIPIRHFDDEIEIVIDPLRQFVSHFPACSSENAPPQKWGI